MDQLRPRQERGHSRDMLRRPAPLASMGLLGKAEEVVGPAAALIRASAPAEVLEEWVAAAEAAEALEAVEVQVLRCLFHRARSQSRIASWSAKMVGTALVVAMAEAVEMASWVAREEVAMA